MNKSDSHLSFELFEFYPFRHQVSMLLKPLGILILTRRNDLFGSDEKKKVVAVQLCTSQS